MGRNRNNKTSNVLKMLNIKALPPPSVKTGGEFLIPEPAVIPESDNDIKSDELDELDELSEQQQQPPVARRRRKAIVKHMKLEKLSESGGENPALKAITSSDCLDKVYIRYSGERQIVSVPLLLINEQIGMAVERFNACACDECLGVIINMALELMPPLYVRVVSAADEDEVNRLIRERRAEAIRVLAKICITANKKPFHEN